MEIPYGFDCYSFSHNEVKYFDSNAVTPRWAGIVPYDPSLKADFVQQNSSHLGHEANALNLPGYVRFTRKNEYYPPEQVKELVQAGRLNRSEINKQLFCGIKIQIGIGVVSSFLQKGLQYRKPIKGRAELINGTWTGIVSGLTKDKDASDSYDMAFGNFLAYDEEFPYMKFGPFFAIESKLVMLTGSPRRIETSSFGTNINRQIWLSVLAAMLVLSLVASIRVHWQLAKHQALEAAIRQLLAKCNLAPLKHGHQLISDNHETPDDEKTANLTYLMQNFFFIYFTMLLNKPCVEFDELIWPKHGGNTKRLLEHHLIDKRPTASEDIRAVLGSHGACRRHYEKLLKDRTKRRRLPTSIRIVSYLWSAACLVMASIYSGEMLAVILLHADQNIDTITQLINSKPPIEPVIRQDDFTYNLMLRSLDSNMLVLHNMTKIIPRTEVYSRRFIEAVSERKQALLGDDELIETIYDIYHKYFALHRSQVTYLQYPISIMYRMDLNVTLEGRLRRGIVQIFEMGLTHRWYQAQKDTYIHFYDKYEKKDNMAKDQDLDELTKLSNDAHYKPLTMKNFYSFFLLMALCMMVAFMVLGLEIAHSLLVNKQIYPCK